MLKFIWRVFLLSALGFVGYAAYDLYRGGYFSLPDLADNEYPISFASGFRAIVVVPEAQPDPSSSKLFRRYATLNPDRRYLGFPVEVPPWFEKEWSRCLSGSEAENAEAKVQIEAGMTDKQRNNLIGARLEAVCGFDLDGQGMRLRGYIYSVPRL